MWEGGLADDPRGVVRQGSQTLSTKSLQTQLGNGDQEVNIQAEAGS